jgi:hypothetical protein
MATAENRKLITQKKGSREVLDIHREKESNGKSPQDSQKAMTTQRNKTFMATASIPPPNRLRQEPE